MRRTDKWMPLAISDHRRETARMTMLARAAYVELLMDYWISGPPPDADETLAVITGMSVKDWRGIAGQVRAAFTTLDGRLHHPRLDFEREKAERISSKRSASASERWSKSDANAHPQAEQTDSTCNANASGLDVQVQTQIHRQIQEEGSLRSQRVREDVDPPGFAEWWSEYPRKDAKGDARKAYAKALKRASPAELLTRLRLYPFQRDPKFIPMPATWINQGRWESAGEAPDTTRPLFSEAPSKTAYLEKYMKVA